MEAKRLAPVLADQESRPALSATIAALVMVAVGCVAGALLLGTPLGPTYAPAAGIGSFALFYVVAQTVERIVEVLMWLLPDKWTFDKPHALREFKAAVLTSSNGVSQPSIMGVVHAKDRLDNVVANRTVVAFGLSAALGAVLCSYLEANFLATLGISIGTGQVAELVAVLVTALVVGGGSKQLHDLISKVSKANASVGASGS